MRDFIVEDILKYKKNISSPKPESVIPASRRYENTRISQIKLIGNTRQAQNRNYRAAA